MKHLILIIMLISITGCTTKPVKEKSYNDILENLKIVMNNPACYRYIEIHLKELETSIDNEQ